MRNQKINKNIGQENKFVSNFGENLKSIREKRGLNRNSAAQLVEVSYSTLQAWEENSGRLPNAWNMQKLAEAYNVSVQDLYTGEISEIKPTNIHDTLGNTVDIEEFVFIPRYNVQASAGYGADVSMENIMHPMAFRKYWIDNILGICAKSLIVIGVKGDSMEGEINNGDIILINKEDNTLLNGIYVIRIEGDLIVKRIQRLPGGIIKVISANSAYESFEIDTNNPPLDFEAIGRVVWHGRNVH
ncbi:helix-turn-helix transcriptional regulator [Ignatzschineria rhizosphaerae]|uniref:Helix-turn-helix transcriptional regulator n=1 Tax=Ignatzschineria rhizosphaerae TaxID=2923279 RepID=A0ABY3X1F4_9GAMM|nr:helix-turn-helix transcriptional regulator [Ignatzschineria rhizosphaerae]UNM95524.1 helix-turn-helix transcriptional regulator [Ignatzschineria rhizosphaerae]